MNIEPLESRIAPATFTVTVLTDVLADDDQLTLREAVALANDTPAADTIKFDPALDGVITLALGTINITETLTILGGGKITISGNDAVRIFNVNNADTVKDHPLTVSGLTFVRGNAGVAVDGGAINSTEGLTIVNCVFADNAAGGDGGAVRVVTTTGLVTIKGAHFSDNTSTDGTGGLFAVSLKGITVTGSVFGGNSGVSAGGAFVGVEASNAKITVSGSTFVRNDTTGSGGGLGVSGVKVSIVNSTFAGNTADLHGGGLRLGEGSYTLSGLKFIGNSAPAGGAISSIAGAQSMALSKSLLEGNVATGSPGGGGIYLTGVVPGFVATISATQIIGNEATGGRGGGIHAFDTGGKITVTGSLIAGNESSSQGGGISIRQNNPSDLVFTLTGSTISGNTAGSSGGGLSLHRHGDFILIKNVIAGNRTSSTVGGVSFDVDGDVTFKNNQVVGNRAASGVGGMDFVADTGSSLIESGNVIAHNEGSTTGGLSILSSVDVTIAKNTKITGNIAGSDMKGGGVTIGSSSGQVKLLGPVLGNHNRINDAFDQTAGTLAGGPAPLPSVAATFTVINLNDSGAGSLRDAIEQANATPAADKIKFLDTLKGVLTLASEIVISEPLTIYGRGQITLSGNDATRIFNIDNADDKDRPVTLSGLTFTKGIGRGAAIAAFESLTIVDCLFVANNAAPNSGGAVFAELGKAAVTVKGSHFAGNSGGLGGGLFASSDKAVTVANTVFAGNVSGNDGGGANLVATATGAKISVIGSLFASNNTLSDGAGLALRGLVDGTKSSKASVTNSSFVRNGSLSEGGGLRLAQGGFALTGVQVIGNTANAAGGGLFVSDASTKLLTVSKSLIAGNEAGAPGGGGVYLGPNAPGFAATFTATQFLGNHTTNGTGGGLLALNAAGKLTLTGSLVAGNAAQTGGGLTVGDGGAEATAVTLTGNAIIGNTSTSNGGGLFLQTKGALALTKNAVLGNFALGDSGGGVLRSETTIALKTNAIVGNRAVTAVAGLFLSGGSAATFSVSGDLFLHNESGGSGGLEIGGSIAGIIAKNTKITGNIGSGANSAGGVTQSSTGAVELLATVLGNLNRTTSANDETFGIFAP